MSKLHFIRDDQDAENEPLRYTACGLDNIYLLNGFKQETIDGEEYITVEDLDGLWKAIGMHLVTKRKVLTAKEVKFLRDQMDLTQAELGARLRVSDQTIARWEKGETKDVPGPADMMLRVLFLASPRAQPEGMEMLRKIIELFDQIGEHDELPTPRAVFRHGRRWREEQKRYLPNATPV
jgi:DNA-binding transcriptional regulator YiaG